MKPLFALSIIISIKIVFSSGNHYNIPTFIPLNNISVPITSGGYDSCRFFQISNSTLFRMGQSNIISNWNMNSLAYNQQKLYQSQTWTMNVSNIGLNKISNQMMITLKSSFGTKKFDLLNSQTLKKSASFINSTSSSYTTIKVQSTQTEYLQLLYSNTSSNYLIIYNKSWGLISQTNLNLTGLMNSTLSQDESALTIWNFQGKVRYFQKQGSTWGYYSYYNPSNNIQAMNDIYLSKNGSLAILEYDSLSPLIIINFRTISIISSLNFSNTIINQAIFLDTDCHLIAVMTNYTILQIYDTLTLTLKSSTFFASLSNFSALDYSSGKIYYCVKQNIEVYKILCPSLSYRSTITNQCINCTLPNNCIDCDSQTGFCNSCQSNFTLNSSFYCQPIKYVPDTNNSINNNNNSAVNQTTNLSNSSNDITNFTNETNLTNTTFLTNETNEINSTNQSNFTNFTNLMNNSTNLTNLTNATNTTNTDIANNTSQISQIANITNKTSNLTNTSLINIIQANTTQTSTSMTNRTNGNNSTTTNFSDNNLTNTINTNQSDNLDSSNFSLNNNSFTYQANNTNISDNFMNQNNSNSDYFIHQFSPFSVLQGETINVTIKSFETAQPIFQTVFNIIQMSPFALVFLGFLSYWNICCLYSILNVRVPPYLPQIHQNIVNFIQTSILSQLNINFSTPPLDNQRIQPNFYVNYQIRLDAINPNVQNVLMILFVLCVIVVTILLRNIFLRKSSHIYKYVKFNIIQVILGQFISFVPFCTLPYKFLVSQANYSNFSQKINNFLQVLLLILCISVPSIFVWQRNQSFFKNINKTSKNLSKSKSFISLKTIKLAKKTLKNQNLRQLFMLILNISVPLLIILPFYAPFFIVNLILFLFNIKRASKAAQYRINSIITACYLPLYHICYLLFYLFGQNEYVLHYAGIFCLITLVLGGFHELCNVIFIPLVQFTKWMIKSFKQNYYQSPKVIDSSSQQKDISKINQNSIQKNFQQLVPKEKREMPVFNSQKENNLNKIRFQVELKKKKSLLSQTKSDHIKQQQIQTPPIKKRRRQIKFKIQKTYKGLYVDDSLKSKSSSDDLKIFQNQNKKKQVLKNNSAKTEKKILKQKPTEITIENSSNSLYNSTTLDTLDFKSNLNLNFFKK